MRRAASDGRIPFGGAAGTEALDQGEGEASVSRKVPEYQRLHRRDDGGADAGGAFGLADPPARHEAGRTGPVLPGEPGAEGRRDGSGRADGASAPGGGRAADRSSPRRIAPGAVHLPGSAVAP